MVKEILHFKPNGSVEPLEEEGRFRGQKVVLEDGKDPVEIPFPHLKLDFVDMQILVPAQSAGRFSLYLLISKYRGSQESVPKELHVWFHIESTTPGTLEVDKYQIHPRTKISSKRKDHVYEIIIPDFDVRNCVYLKIAYSVPSPGYNYGQSTVITAGVQSEIPHILAATTLYAYRPQAEEIFDYAALMNNQIREFTGVKGRYTLGSLLPAAGATACLFYGTMHQGETTQCPCVLKFLDPNWSLDGFTGTEDEKKQQVIEDRFRFNLEGKILQEADHPYLVKCYDSFTILGHKQDQNGQQVDTFLPVLVLEKLTGMRMFDYIQEHYDPARRQYKADIDKVLLYIFQVCDALEYLHMNFIYHRDIKPQNIMIVEAGTKAVLLDLGAARTSGSRSYNLIGTEAYMPPEYINKYRYDEKSDIFSLGIVFYQILTGRHPFADDPDPEKDKFFPFFKAAAWELLPEIRRNMFGPDKYAITLPTKKCATEIPQGIQEVLTNMLNKDPKERTFELDDIGRYCFCYLRKLSSIASLAEKLEDFCDNGKPLEGPESCPLKFTEHLTRYLVCVAEHKTKPVVVKFANPKMYSDDIDNQEEFFIRFKRQMYILASLYNRRIPKLLFTYLHPAISYLVLERVPGESLETIIKNGWKDKQYQMPLDLADCYRCMRDVVGVLITIYSLPLHTTQQAKRRWFSKFTQNTVFYHRNIEPANIILAEQGTYLLGFGKVKNTTQSVSRRAVISNFFYLAKEYLEDEEAYTVKTDIFSVGVCMHLLLTGKHPYLSDSNQNFLFASATDIYTLAREYLVAIKRSDTPKIEANDEKAKQLLSKLLSHNPDERPKPEELYHELQKMLVAEEKAHPKQTKPSAPKEKKGIGRLFGFGKKTK